MWRGIARNLSYCTSFRQLLDPRYFAVNIVLQRAAGSEGVLGAVLEITLLGGSHGAYQVKKFSACHMNVLTVLGYIMIVALYLAFVRSGMRD